MIFQYNSVASGETSIKSWRDERLCCSRPAESIGCSLCQLRINFSSLTLAYGGSRDQGVLERKQDSFSTLHFFSITAIFLTKAAKCAESILMSSHCRPLFPFSVRLKQSNIERRYQRIAAVTTTLCHGKYCFVSDGNAAYQAVTMVKARQSQLSIERCGIMRNSLIVGALLYVFAAFVPTVICFGSWINTSSCHQRNMAASKNFQLIMVDRRHLCG